MDDMKDIFMDTNPYYLALTMLVYVFHSLFEFLAIKNEVQFWRNLESAKGLSLRSLYVELAMGIIVFFYLLDEDV